MTADRSPNPTTHSAQIAALSAKIDALAQDIERTAREVTSAEARLIIELGDRMQKYEQELADLRWAEKYDEGFPGIPHSAWPW